MPAQLIAGADHTTGLVRYSRQRRVLHWLSAAVILWAMLSGWLAIALNDELRQRIAGFNVGLTTLFLPLFCWRLALAVLRPAPALPAGIEPRLAHFGHALLYAVTTIVLVSGALMVQREVDVLGIVRVPVPKLPAEFQVRMAFLHRSACAVLGVLVAGHIAAVALHHRRGIPILYRMR